MITISNKAEEKCVWRIEKHILLLFASLFITVLGFSQAPPGCPAATGFPVTGQTFVVTRTDDWPDENNSPVVGQLRWAIAQANRCRPTGGGLHRIVFNVPGTGPFIFKPYIMFPRIQASTIIDGFTQPGSSYGSPMIVIDGSFASNGTTRCVNYTTEGYGSYCSDFSSSSDIGRCFEENYDYTLGGSGNNIVWRGLVINNFHTTSTLVKIGVIHMNTGTGFVVEGCFLGTDYTGNIAQPNDAGITINSPGNCSDPINGNHIIGSTNPALKNIISGNDQWGIQIMKTYGVKILNNYIGIANNGSPLPNGGHGIQMWLWNYDCLIKGNSIDYNKGCGIAIWYGGLGCSTDGVYSSRFEGNNISHNLLNGMQFLNTQVYDHVVGVDVSGSGLPNNISYNGQNGIYVAEFFDGSSYTGGAAKTIQIRENVMICNGIKAINLNYGSPNPGNHNIQKPVINLGTSNGSIINGTAPANKLIDIYAMSSCAGCHSSGAQGDGHVWFGSTASDGAGNWSFSGTFHGQLSATATDNTGAINSRNTSEFSTCLYVDLPVSFLFFDVKKTGSSVLIDWTTSSEKNSSYFEIQRSSDGINFETIQIINAAGNSSSNLQYSYIDSDVLVAAYYYKIKEVDLAGKYTYSTLKSIHLDRNNQFHIFPNPISNILTIESDEIILSAKLFNVQGKLIYYYDNINQDHYAIHLVELVEGIYILELFTDSDAVYREKIIK